MTFYEIIGTSEFEESLRKLRLDAEEVETFRESIDWLLSRNPEAGQRGFDRPITIFYLWYRRRLDEAYVVVYRIEGHAVILEDVKRDISLDF